MAVNLSPIGGVAGQFFDNNGNPLAGGKIYTYAAGTTTNQATYTTAAGVIAHSNPIILDAAGRVPSGEIWLTDGLQYKFVIKTSTDVQIGSYDNIIGINSNFINFLTEEEVQVATAGQTVFTLTTTEYQPSTNTLSVFVDGVNQYDGVSYSYVETNSTTVTFSAGLHVGALVKFTTAQTLSSGVTDASLVTYDPPFTGSVLTNVEEKLSETVSVKDFGAVGDGVTDDTVAIQDTIDAIASGTILFPEGEYLINSDITLLSKGSDALSERFAIQATGAKLTGAGNLIIDSCKRLEITGLQMPTQDILMRGCWWSQFNNLQIKQIIVNDAAATSFNDSYWNQFNNCLLQNITTSNTAAAPANEWTFNSCDFRGDANHGFTSTFNYALEFNGNDNCQSWSFFGGDVSYYGTAIYNIDAGNTSDVMVSFNGVYFDTLLPQLTTRARTNIETINCFDAIGVGSQNPLTTSFSATTGTITNLLNTQRSSRFNGATHLNLVPGGDLINDLGTWEGANKPISFASGATITTQTGGLNGVYLNINQAATTSNQIFFRHSALPFSGKMTGTLVVRNANVGSKTMRVGMFNLFQNITITNTEWTFVTLTTETAIAAGATTGSILFTDDGTAFNVDVAYIGLHYGIAAPLLSQSNGFGTIEYSESTYNPASIPAGGVLTQDFTVTGATLGDFVLASTPATTSDLDNVVFTARVSATNTVKLRIYNFSASPIDFGTLFLRFRVWKKDLYQ
jgi:hypothetical protein